MLNSLFRPNGIRPDNNNKLLYVIQYKELLDFDSRRLITRSTKTPEIVFALNRVCGKFDSQASACNPYRYGRAGTLAYNVPPSTTWRNTTRWIPASLKLD